MLGWSLEWSRALTGHFSSSLLFSAPSWFLVEWVAVSWQEQAGMAVTFLQSSALVKSQDCQPFLVGAFKDKAWGQGAGAEAGRWGCRRSLREMCPN